MYIYYYQYFILRNLTSGKIFLFTLKYKCFIQNEAFHYLRTKGRSLNIMCVYLLISQNFVLNKYIVTYF